MKRFFQKFELLLTKNNPLFTSKALFIVITLLFLASVFSGIKSNMHLSTQESLHLYHAKYAAAAISSLEHNLSGFIGYNNIFKVLMSQGTIDDAILKQAVAVKDFASGGTFKIVTVDLGYVSFAKIAFSLFGYSVSSWFYLYFTILLLTAILYIIEFRNDKNALILLGTFILSFFLVGLRASDMPYNVGVIYSYRFMSLLTILPALHLLIVIFTNKVKVLLSFTTLIFIIQSALVIWLHFIRLSSQWIIICMAVLFICYIFMYFLKPLVAYRKLQSAFKEWWTRSFCIVIFFVVLIVSKAAFNYSINDVYKQRGEGAHVFWHSIYVGLALHPDIRKTYTNERPVGTETVDNLASRMRYKPNDQDSYSASLKWLHDNNEDIYSLFNFKKEDNVNFKSIFSYYRNINDPEVENPPAGSRKIDMEIDYNWGSHDKILHNLVFSVFKNNFKDVLEVTFILKPAIFAGIYLNDFLKISTLRSLIKFNIYRVLLSIFLIYFALFIIANKTSDKFTSLLMPVIYLFIFSLIIPIAVYPEPWTIADQALILTTIVYFLVVALFHWAFSYLLCYKKLT